ncbi:MAG: hypothetical protein Q9159_001024 [Coniocarpon cinnabarinum]
MASDVDEGKLSKGNDEFRKACCPAAASPVESCKIETLPVELLNSICDLLLSMPPTNLKAFTLTCKTVRAACTRGLERMRQLHEQFGKLDLVVYRRPRSPEPADVCGLLGEILSHPIARLYVRSLKVRTAESGASTFGYTNFDYTRTQALVRRVTGESMPLWEENFGRHAKMVDERSSIQHLVLEGLEASRRDKNWLERSTRKQLQTIELVNTPASIETLEIVFKGAKELQTFQYQIRDFDDTAPDWAYWDVVVEVMRETFVNSLTKLSLTCVNPLSTQSLTMRPLPSLGAFENIRYFHTQASLLIHDRESNLSKSTKTIYFQASVAPKDRSIQVTRLNAILPPSVKRVRLDMFELMEISIDAAALFGTLI